MNIKQSITALLTGLTLAGTSTAQLLDIPDPGLPNTSFQITPTRDGTDYNAATQTLTVDAQPVGTQFLPGFPRMPFSASDPADFKINIQIDNSGNLIGGVPGPDLLLSGSVTDFFSGNTYSGALLTGEIIEFGARDSGGTTDFMNFRFELTGGTLGGLFPTDNDIGVVLTLEQSQYTGDWSISWSGDAKGNAGPISPVPVGSARLGDFVWHDQDRDGVQDASEPGLNGVTVELLDENGNFLDSTITTSTPLGSGFYEFTELMAGEYTVRVVETTLPPNFQPTISNATGDQQDSDGSPVTVNLADAENNPTLDFGYSTPAEGKIGNYVWLDTDKDGIQDTGEAGINGVTVNLIDSNGSIIASTVTANGGPNMSNGYYQFTGVEAGDYTVEVVDDTGPLSSLNPSPAGAGNDDTVDSNGVNGEASVSLALGTETINSIDFGYFADPTGVLGDRVWNDLNRNGIQDASELGLGLNGVTVILKDSFGTPISSTTTSGDGNYLFEGLAEGSYIVEIDDSTLPSGFVAADDLVGTDTGVDSNGSPSPAALDSDSDSDLSIDFGYHLPCTGSIGDYIFKDSNGNGLQDTDEVGINGVKISLVDDQGSVVAMTLSGVNPDSGAMGYYSFDAVCAGTYEIRIDSSTAPAGFTLTQSDAGQDDSVDSDGDVVSVTLTSDDTVITNVDAGYIPPGNGVIGNYVWNDSDRDGNQDSGEVGINGVTVELYDGNGDYLATTTTGIDPTTGTSGFYEFTGLLAGSYEVRVVESSLPDGFVATNALASGDESDSNGSPASTVLITENSIDRSIDFGYYSENIGSIGNFVWNDSNANGIQESGEPGIDGVRVVLRDANGNVVATEFTANGGQYLFDGLAPGEYSVEVDSSSSALDGFSASPVNQGSSDLDSDTSPVSVNLGLGEENLTLDFGYNRPGAIGDKVYYDSNGNGVQDLGEPGLEGVTVTLLDSTGAVISSTVTNGDGGYLFFGLPAGDYQVQINPADLPAGVVPSADLDGIASPNLTAISIGDGEERLDADFGYKPDTANCNSCDGKVTQLTFQYTGDGAHVEIVQKKDGESVFSGYVNQGDLISIQGVDKKDTLGTEIKIIVDGMIAERIHTSCSVEIGPGQVYGDFTIVDGASRNGGPLCPIDTAPPGGGDDCAACDGKITALTLAYHGDAGHLEVRQKKGGVLFSSQISTGDVFSLQGTDKNGTMGTEISFYLDGHEIQSIHTSCSDEIGIGQFWGAFEVLDGASLRGGQLCPVDGGGNEPPTGGSCAACDGKITTLTLGYHGDAGHLVVEQKKGGVLFSDQISAGDFFTLQGTDKRGTMGTEISFYLDGHEIQSIHTSCSDEIGIGQFWGDFEVLDGTSLRGGQLCPVDGGSEPPSDGGGNEPPAGGSCGECDGKVNFLALEYTGSDVAHITVIQKKDNDTVFDAQVVPGEHFEFSGTDKKGTLGTEILISVNGNFAQAIHTSCSDDIGIGSVFGEFLVVDGSSRNGGQFCQASNGDGGSHSTSSCRDRDGKHHKTWDKKSSKYDKDKKSGKYDKDKKSGKYDKDKKSGKYDKDKKSSKYDKDKHR